MCGVLLFTCVCVCVRREREGGWLCEEEDEDFLVSLLIAFCVHSISVFFLFLHLILLSYLEKSYFSRKVSYFWFFYLYVLFSFPSSTNGHWMALGHWSM